MSQNNLSDGSLNYIAITFKKGSDFAEWLKTIPVEYHQSLKIHRSGYIALMKNRGNKNGATNNNK